MRAGIAICCAALAGCVPIDRRSLADSPAYGLALREIDQRVVRAKRDRGRVLTGFGKAEIVSPDGVPLAGYGDRKGEKSEGVRDPAFVRAFAIRAGEASIVLFTADLLLVTDALRDRVTRAIDAPNDSLFFTASHTHSGPGAFVPGLLGELVFGDFDARALDAIVDAYVAAGREAIADLSPGEIGVAEVSVPGIIHNRVERDGPIDDRLFVLRLAHDDRVAVMWSFGCHAVTLKSDNRRISADYPGTIARAFEGERVEILGFAAGGVGSSNPKKRGVDDAWMTTPLITKLERAISLARDHSKQEVSLAYAQAVVPLPEPRYRVSESMMIYPPGLAGAALDLDRARFGAIAIDDTVLLHVPAELSGELTRDARTSARAHGISLAIFPFDGSYTGYVVSRRVYDLAESERAELARYETQTMAFFGPWAADYLMRLALRIASGVHVRATRE